MDLSKAKTADLEKELKQRLEITGNSKLLVAIGGFDGAFFTECFKVVESSKDLDFLEIAQMRARFNGQRMYQMFYFKSDSFDQLNDNFKNNNEEFSKWLNTSPLVKKERL